MSFLSFLKDTVLEEVAQKAPAVGGPKKQRNPNPLFMGLRIWKDGSIYPSVALVEKFNLEYPVVKLTMETLPIPEGSPEGTKAQVKRTYTHEQGIGNGLDCIDSRSWPQYKGDRHFIAISIVPKNLPKVDIFGSTKYADDGTPISSVLDQGPTSFGAADLLPTLKEVYNVEPNEEGYIDLMVDTSINLKQLSSNGIFLFPKKVNRGEHKGKADYQRRENVDVFGLVPAAMLQEEPTTVVEEENAAGTNDVVAAAPVEALS